MKKILSGLIISCFSFVFGYGIIQSNNIETYQVNADIKTRVATEHDMSWDDAYCHPLSEPVGENPKPLKDYNPTVIYTLNGEVVDICDDENLELKTKVGCDIEGWYYNASLTDKVSGTTIKEVAYPIYMETAPGNDQCVTEFDYVTILYGKCKETPTCPDTIDKTYTLTYYVNGEATTENLEVGQDKNLMTTTREGYEFMGWYTDSALTRKFTGTTKNLNPREKYDADNCLIGYENVKLYSAWKKESVTCDPAEMTVTVSFETNGGNKIDDEKITLGAPSYDNLQVPVKEDYKFEGWYYNKELTNKVVGKTFGDLEYTYIMNEDECITGYNNITLYAKWSKIPTNPETGDNIIIYCIFGIILIASGVVVTRKLSRK